MNENELQRLIEDVSSEVFNKPFTHAASFNRRLRTTGGRYKLSDSSIEINPVVLQKYGVEELIGVIKHELCHYHLHREGKGYKHGDKDFKKLLAETGSPRYCKQLEEIKPQKTVHHIYRCTSCRLEYKRKRKMDTRKYRCGKCRGEIEYIKKME
ncbi:protein SprT [Sporosarcina sp. NCCP-2222]|uniref:SprT family protein n=1 Tax=Sporosarcina sp. NCCP-2222 TaxID=2935073 RepID=UPI002085D85F|nr:SprT family protein [Sporosarcina sp. NCCP-2222]GKV54807.1 protein SprT [Sporosarcina sp. NCCP-2222]